MEVVVEGAQFEALWTRKEIYHVETRDPPLCLVILSLTCANTNTANTNTNGSKDSFEWYWFQPAPSYPTGPPRRVSRRTEAPNK